jgi:hypothetical protein
MSKAPFTIRRTIAQRSTGGGHQPSNAKHQTAAQEIQERGLPAPSVSESQQIGFFGHTQTGEKRVVVVLAGEGAPTPTEGWVKIAKVPRFQRVAFTIPEGYEPYGLTVPIQFEAMVKTKERKDLEQDITNLEWMAGRTPNPPEGEVKGEPPYVEIYTVNSEGQQIPLVPRSFQGEPGRSQQWYLTNIAFDPNPERDTGGARLRQKATVTLTEIVSTPSALSRNRQAREQVKKKYETVFSSEADNTVRRIAVAFGIPSSWEAILKANPSIGSAEKALKPGTAVRIPLTAFRQVPA